ncbi:hypothetical protein HHK36_007541 [Tetracentron sinense]|uniref:WD repeat-containing protein 74 n=1 Tax=Tetracentron sinense TaxID=13715 RepID=A0A835DLV8_TETSI|nr:hypothetical protein HHK36_007541 [Tetracentron sinense]
MPRTSAVECPGCPPIRALAFDVLGLVKVVEAHGKQESPKVVEIWGEPDSSRCVLAASIDDRKTDPLVAVARKNGLIEVLNPLNGDLRVAITKAGDAGHLPEDDNIAGLYLFKRKRLDLSSSTKWNPRASVIFLITKFGSCTLLTCTTKGSASLRSFDITDSPADSTYTDSPRTWNVCASGEILCSKVDGNEDYALFGGKGVEINVWDLEKCSKIWTAKSPPKNSLGIFTASWFTSATFLCKEDHRKIVVGTNNHQVRLYDISAQRRPIISFDFRESPIKVVTEDLDGYTIYLGTGSGDLASVDMRTGKLLGCFMGKCSGSIRSITRHSELSVIASCGLDSYLRYWDIKTRQLLAAVFLKQHLTSVVIDSNFADKVDPPPNEAQKVIQTQVGKEDASLPSKRQNFFKESGHSKKLKHKSKSKKRVIDEDDIAS